MTAVIPGNSQQPVQPRRAVGTPGRLDVQAVRARRGDRAGDRPRHDLLHLGAVHLHERALVRGRLRGREAVDGDDLRPHLRRHDLGDEATLRSDNTVYAQLTLDVGPDNVWRMARRLGVEPAGQKPVASIGLGSLSVSPLDMAAAYATFASGGIYAQADRDPQGGPPERQGRHEAWEKPQTKRVLSQGVAWKVNQVLGENALYGTGAGSGDGIHPNAGKTGTTDEPRRRLVRRLHARPLDRRLDGLPEAARSRCSTSTGAAVAGATFPVPIWHLFMDAAEKGLPVRQFLTPDHEPVYSLLHAGLLGLPGDSDARPRPRPTKPAKTTPLAPARDRGSHSSTEPAAAAVRRADDRR